MRLSEHSKIMRETLLRQYLTRARGVLHLGAHLGHEAAKYQQFNKPVIWVEAIPSVCVELSNRLAGFSNQRAFCALLDNVDGLQRTFKISNNMGGVSSSIFDFGDYGNGAHSLWPDLDLHMTAAITLPTLRLDTVLHANQVSAAQFDFWVVDLQGAELLGLQGAEHAINNCNAILVEISQVEVYEGGVLWDELRRWLDNHGFYPLWLPDLPHDDVLFVHERTYKQVEEHFGSEHYLRHNSRRLEHLASLDLPLRNCTVLEVGAGIGDHTSFYLDRGCKVTVTDVRPENIEILKRRYGDNSNVEIMQLDMEAPKLEQDRAFDVIHCYGLLYHLANPEDAIRFMSQHGKLLCMETCVAPDDQGEVNCLQEPGCVFSQSFYGQGCRPNQQWVLNTLSKYFTRAYLTPTQPDHPEFTRYPEGHSVTLYRRVYVAVQGNNYLPAWFEK